jgi:hypothetical protein
MQPAEKRKSLRRSIAYPASIEIGGVASPVACTLCDASQHGAQLAVADPSSVPNEFILSLSADGAVRRRCRVIWRAESSVGVEFLKDPKKVTRAVRVPFVSAPAAAPADQPEETPAQVVAEPSAAAADKVDVDALESR